MDIFDEIEQSGDIFDQIEQQPTEDVQPVAQPEGLASKLGDRVERTTDMVQRQMGSDSVIQNVSNAPVAGILAAGQAAGGALDIVGAGVSKVVGAVTPEPVKEFVGDAAASILGTDAGKAALNAIAQGQEKWDQFSENFPDAAMAIEAAVNLSAFGITKKAGQMIGREAADIASDTTRAFSRLAPEQIDNKILGEIKYGINKGIRPTVVGKDSFSKINSYYRKASEAVEAIVDSKSSLNFVDDAGNFVSGRLPENLSEFSQAIMQTKKEVFKQYDKLASSVSGESVDPSSIARMLKILAQKKEIRGAAGDVSNYALKRAEELESIGKLTTTQAQDMLQIMNKQLESFYKNPTATEANNRVIEAYIANALRKKLDKVIESATGKEYQSLKNKYGALSAIEKEVNKRFIVDARKNAKGLLDFTDIASGNQVISAVTRGDALRIANAATTKIISEIYKKFNDPNEAIKKMFKNVDALKSRKESFTPNSALFRGGANAVEDYQRMRRDKALYNELDASNKEFFDSIHKQGLE